MTKMNCISCQYFEYCRSNNTTIEVTTSDDLQNELRVFVLGVEKECPMFCKYREVEDEHFN